MNQSSKEVMRPYSMLQNLRFVLHHMWLFERKLFFMSVARVPLLVILPLLAILMPKLVIDCLTAGVDPGKLVGAVALVTLGMVICNFLSRYFDGRISLEAVSNRVHYLEMVIGKTLHTDYANLENEDGRKKQQRAIEAHSDSNKGPEAILNPLILFGADVFGFVLYGSILTALNPLIIVFLLVTAIISVFITRYAQIYEHKNKDNWTLIDRKLWYLLDKSADFAAGKDIRMYNMSGWFERLFGIQLNERTWWLKRVERKNYLANVVDGLLVFIRDGAAYSYLIYLTLKGSISVADFTLYFGTVAGFSTWLSGITNEITQLSHLSLDISDVRDYLDLPERNGIGSEFVSSSAPSLPYEIELEHVTFQYPGSNRSILNDLNLKIQPGEKVALVGVNGAGKSTLVKLLCGLYQPHSGRVFINGNNSLDYNPDQIFQLFGVVFQEIHVLPVSIARNIATDCNVPVNVERVMECLRLAGLEEKVLSLPQGIETPLVKEVNEAAIQFSGGELQKLLLARSLYKDAPILILDEPTAALDPISENELYLRYNDLTANKTSVFISHRLTSTRFCDRIVFLSDGNIAETGTHEELMELNGQYAKMYKIQSHYYQERIDEMDGGGLLHEFQ